MNTFSIMTDETAILLSKGVYTQKDLYTCEIDDETRIYAQHGSGYILLLKDGRTSVPTIRWEKVNFVPTFNKIGRMIK